MRVVVRQGLYCTSVTGLNDIESVTVIDDYVCSDHLPLRVIVRCDLATNHHCVSGRKRNDFIDWKTAGVHDYDKFDGKSSEYLSNVDVCVSLFNCTDQSCKLHEGEIDRLYGDIIKSLNMAANNSIPRRKSGTGQQTACWNDIVKESHEVARSDFKFWGRIHEWGITYDGLISRSDITELELGPSENSYSRARQMSVTVVLEVGGNHTGCLVTKRCTAYGRMGSFVQLDNQVGSDIIT